MESPPDVAERRRKRLKKRPVFIVPTAGHRQVHTKEEDLTQNFLEKLRFLIQGSAK
jgi:hypothetical protein